MHLWDGHVFVVDVFFLPGILLSGLLMCYLAGMYFRYGNIFIANMINLFLFLLHFQNIQMFPPSHLLMLFMPCTALHSVVQIKLIKMW